MNLVALVSNPMKIDQKQEWLSQSPSFVFYTQIQYYFIMIKPAKQKLQHAISEIKRRVLIDITKPQDLDEIIDILMRDKYTKTPGDLELLHSAFDRFSFFQDLQSKMGVEAMLPLYKELTYEKMSARQIVFNLGDLGRKFYIILKGSVYVLVKKKGLQDKDQPEEPTGESQRPPTPRKKKLKKNDTQGVGQVMLTQVRERKVIRLQTVIFSAEDEEKMTDKEFIETKFSDFIQVGEMKAGDSFGEIALTKQMPRTATILCKEETHFATLTRESFNKLLSEYYQIVQHQNVRLLQKVAMFSDWNEPMLNQLYYHFTFKEFKMNQTIYKEHDEANEIYLVKEGEVEISHIVKIHIRAPSESEKLINHFISVPDRNATKSRRIKSALLTVGQVFGQEEIINNTKRTQMAVCVSDHLILFVLDKQRFLTYCQRGKAIEKVKESMVAQHEWRVTNDETICSVERPKLQSSSSENQMTLKLLHMRNKSQGRVPSSDQVETSSQFPRKNSNFIMPKICNVLQRVSDKVNVTSQKLLQEKTHLNTPVGNFNLNYDFIKKNMKPYQSMDLQSGFFNTDQSKVSTINAIKKVLPGALREKYEIPRHMSVTTHLVRQLKLPNVLRHIHDQKIECDERYGL